MSWSIATAYVSVCVCISEYICVCPRTPRVCVRGCGGVRLRRSRRGGMGQGGVWGSCPMGKRESWWWAEQEELKMGGVRWTPSRVESTNWLLHSSTLLKRRKGRSDERRQQQQVGRASATLSPAFLLPNAKPPDCYSHRQQRRGCERLITNPATHQPTLGSPHYFPLHRTTPHRVAPHHSRPCSLEIFC